MGTNYIDAYERQLNEHKFALLRALAGWWVATTKGKDKVRARENVLNQIGAMHAYLDTIEIDIKAADIGEPEKAEVTL